MARNKQAFFDPSPGPLVCHSYQGWPAADLTKEAAPIQPDLASRAGRTAGTILRCLHLSLSLSLSLATKYLIIRLCGRVRRCLRVTGCVVRWFVLERSTDSNSLGPLIVHPNRNRLQTRAHSEPCLSIISSFSIQHSTERTSPPPPPPSSAAQPTLLEGILHSTALLVHDPPPCSDLCNQRAYLHCIADRCLHIAIEHPNVFGSTRKSQAESTLRVVRVATSEKVPG